MNTKFTKTVAATGLTVSAFVAVCGFTNTAYADDQNVASVSTNAHVAQSSSSFNDYVQANKAYVEAYANAVKNGENKSKEKLEELKKLKGEAVAASQAHVNALKQAAAEDAKKTQQSEVADDQDKAGKQNENTVTDTGDQNKAAQQSGDVAKEAGDQNKAAQQNEGAANGVGRQNEGAANGVGKDGSVNPSGSNDETDFSDDKVIESVARTGISFEEFKSKFITGQGKDGRSDKKISAKQIEKYNNALKTLRQPSEDIYNKNVRAAEMIRDNKVTSTEGEKEAANKFLEVKKGFGDKTFLQLTLDETKTAETADKEFNSKLSWAVKNAIANYGKPVPSAPAPSVPAPAAPEVKAPAEPEANAPAAPEVKAPENAAPENAAPENAAPEAKTPEVPATPEAPAAESPAEVAPEVPEVPEVSEVLDVSEAEEDEDWWTELVKYVDEPEFHELIGTIESDFTAELESAADSKSADSKSADSTDFDYDFEDLELDELHSLLGSLLDADFDALLAE